LKAAQGENKLMKLMKHITIALVLCAIPAMAFAQTVSCDDCTHAVSYYVGGGGLIAEADIDDDADADDMMVTYVASCNGVTRTGELMPNDDDIVSMLFSGDLACDVAKGASLQLGPVKDGGWYWLTDADNSAVGSLVAADLKGYATTDPTDPGSDDITMTAGNGAVFVKQASTGRVGILPTILASAPVAALRTCGFDGAGTPGSPFTRRTSGCAMGDGGTITLATTYDGFRGATSRLMDKGSITRPVGVGATSTVTIDLWGNHSGHFTTSADAGAVAYLGNPAVALTGARPLGRLTGVTYTGTQGTGGPGGSPLSDTAVAGITLDTTSNVNAVDVNVVADASYCSKTNNHTATVNITALITPEGAAMVTPSVKRNAMSGVAGGITFNVMCPSGAEANQGQELVPENPFPTDR
jgi:hypothetical protein